MDLLDKERMSAKIGMTGDKRLYIGPILEEFSLVRSASIFVLAQISKYLC